MFRFVCILIASVFLTGVVAPQFPSLHSAIGVEQAFAEKKKKRKSLFDLLFKNRKKYKRQSRKDKNKRKRIVITGPGSNKKKRSRVAASAPKVVVVKSENASKVLVVGDFIAGGLASGLEKLVASNPNLVVVSKTKASSGLVRDDVVNWPVTVPSLIEEHKPIAVIILVGMNDRQQMRLSTGRTGKLSEAWLAAYNERAQKIFDAGKASNVPVVWVGLPPVRSGRMNADYLAFNEIFRSRAETSGGTFVDIWDGFTNAEGKFVSAGPDINGQIVRLRGSKGINMTKAGKEKLAFYAERALKKLGIVGQVDSSALAGLGPGSNVAQPEIPQYDPVGTGKTIVISLGSAGSDGGAELEGEGKFLESEDGDKSVSYNLVQKGLSQSPRTGRVDGSWGNPVARKPAEEEKEADSNEKTSSLASPSVSSGVN